MQTTSLSTLFVAALAVATAAQDGPRKITITPKVGASVHFRTTRKQTQVLEAMGHESNNEIVAEVNIKVDEVAGDGTVKATATWLRVRGNMQTMAGEMEFDTKNPDSGSGTEAMEGFADACAALIGTKTAVVFNPDGKLKDRKPLDELADNLASKMAGPARMQMQGIVGSHALEGYVSMFGYFGSEPVAVGGTWNEKRTMGARRGMTMQTDATHKLDAMDDAAYTVSFTGTIGMAPKTEEKKDDDADDDDDDGQAQMMRDMMARAQVKDGKVSGKSLISRTDGLLASGDSKSSMAIHMDNPMGGDEPFVVRVQQSTKIERFTPEAKDAPASPKK